MFVETNYKITNYMSVPKKRRTKSSVKRRGSHFALKGVTTMTCEKCGNKRLPHNACLKCGFYKGKSIHDEIVISAPEAKKDVKAEKVEKKEKSDSK